MNIFDSSCFHKERPPMVNHRGLFAFTPGGRKLSAPQMNGYPTDWRPFGCLYAPTVRSL